METFLNLLNVCLIHFQINDIYWNAFIKLFVDLKKFVTILFSDESLKPCCSCSMRSFHKGGGRGTLGGQGGGHFTYFPIKVIFMPYSSDFHSFKICFKLVSLNCPTTKITIFSFYTKSLQRTRTPHILIYLLNIGIHLYHALALVCICIFSSSV